jgi:hypothetical protein
MQMFNPLRTRWSVQNDDKLKVVRAVRFIFSALNLNLNTLPYVGNISR